jgi:Putative auto-transporter adhesin, head GIN domain
MPITTRLSLPFAFVTALAAAVAVHAADRSETRAAAGFNAIGLAAPVTVDVVQGDAEGLVVEGDGAALAELETVVEGGTLKIRTRSRKDVPGMSKVRVHVSAKAIEALNIAGSGDITAATLRAPTLKVAVSGSGDVRIDALDSTTLTVSVAGSGDVLVGGKADTLTTSIAGSGDVKAGKLAARTAKVSISGSGDVTVWAREQLSVSVVGSGDVRFYGDPEVKRLILGSGSLRRLGATPS